MMNNPVPFYMATGTIQTYGYKVGESTTFLMRSLGRVTISGITVLTYIVTDKPVLASNCTITIPSSANFYRVGHNDTASVNTSKSTTLQTINKNIITFQIPINEAVTAGRVYFIETTATVTFA